jgi:hypothetical protein
METIQKPKLAYKDFLINQNQPTRDNAEYVPFWLKHIEYCKSGVSVGGIEISGWLYWHLNFFKIPVDEKDKYGNKIRVITSPPLRDNEYYLNWGREKGYKEQKPIIIFGSRRIAKSTILASDICYSLFIMLNSNSVVIGASTVDINNITDYITFFYSNRPECFSDLMKFGDFTREGGNVEIAFSKRETTKKDPTTGKAGLINPITPHLLKIGNDNKYIFSTLSVRNLEFGTKHNKQEMLAGITPSKVIFDEVGKFSYSLPFSALKPALIDSFGEYRTIPMFVGCLTKGNKVWDSDGNMLNIEDLQKNQGIKGFSVKNQEVTNEKITYWQKPFKKPCVKITTNKGLEISCSTDHPILSRKYLESQKRIGRAISFEEASKLKINDVVAVADIIPIQGTKKMWNPYLVGCLIGDGSYGKDKTPVLSNEDNEIWEHLDSLNISHTIEKSYTTKKNRLYKEVRIKSITQKLRELGIYGQTKKDKDLPINIHSYDKESICELIAGLIDTDGCILNIPSNRNITLTSSSKKLVDSLKLLLLRLGIHSNIDVKRDKRVGRKIMSKEEFYLIGIYDKTSVEIFYENIPIKINRKKETLQKLIDHYKNRKSKKNQKYSGLRFEKISKIEDIGEQEVYNLTAGTTNTYLANGIVTHNTGGDIDSSKDAERDFLNAEENGFLAVNSEEYKNLVTEGNFEYKQKSNLKTGFFAPAQMCNAGGVKKEIPISAYIRKSYTNEDLEDLEGFIIQVTDWVSAPENLQKEIQIEEKKSDKEGKKAKMYYPFQPEDCFLYSGNNPFPVEEAKVTLQKIKDSGNIGEKVILKQEINGTIIIEPSSKRLIETYPFEGGTHDAPCVMYERPIHDNPYEIRKGIYVAGFDGYKIAESKTTDSVGTFYIYKRMCGLDGLQNQIVFSLATRPPKDEDFYQQVMLAVLKYNADLLPERDTNLYNFLANKKMEHLIVNCQSVVFRYTPNTNASTTYGLPATPQNKEHYLKMIQKYCNDNVLIGYTDNDEPITIKGIERITDPVLLKEIIDYGKEKNADRLAAFGHALVWDNELQTRGVIATQDPYKPPTQTKPVRKQSTFSTIMGRHR